MIIFNFNRAFDTTQYNRIKELLNDEALSIHDVPCRWRAGYTLADTAKQLVDSAGEAAGFGSKSWEIERFIINPPGLAPLALAIFAEIHGRRGNFPRIISIDRRDVAGEAEYQVIEITDLQKIRNSARAY